MSKVSKWGGVSLQASRGPYAGDVDKASGAARIGLSVAPTFTRSFITGSRAYGVPRSDSDIDLVVLVDQKDLDLLQTMTKDIGTNNNYDPKDARCFRFGNLNLLCCQNPKHFFIWKAGTEHLIEKSRRDGPVSREFAIGFLAELRVKNGIEVY